jgi:hypothetical protein
MSLVLAVLAGLLFSASGCGYVKNVRDDVLDLGTLAVGIVPPVAPGEDGPQAVGPIPPAFGVYLEATEFMHLGYLFKATGDLSWDRRGLGIMVDARRKMGIGPWHSVAIMQQPIIANEYKTPGSGLEGWRAHMDSLRDPIWGRPGKVLIYGRTISDDLSDTDRMTYEDYVRQMEGDEESTFFGIPELPWLHRGWQDWEMVSLEVAVPCPCLLHTGFYFRAGFDCSQVFDLALGLVGLDLYSDAAYEFWSGDYKYLTPEQEARREAMAAEAAAEAERQRQMEAQAEAEAEEAEEEAQQ